MYDEIERRDKIRVRSVAYGIVTGGLGIFGILSGRVIVIAGRNDPEFLFKVVAHQDDPFGYFLFVITWSLFALYCAFNSIFEMPGLTGRRQFAIVATVFAGAYCLNSFVGR